MRAGKVGIVVQARMGSIRLPGKSLLDFHGEPMVGRILERLRRCKSVDAIILAIPKNDQNTPLKNLAEKYGTFLFLGPEEDVLDRYFLASQEHNLDFVVRFPADNPVPEPKEIDRIISHHKKLKRKGFSSNLAEINGSGYPDGIGAEIFDFDLLAEVNFKEKRKNLREHVHLNFFDYAKGMPVDETWCPVSTLECPEEFARPDLILDVNTKTQYLTLSRLYEDLYPKNPNFDILDIIKWYKSEGLIG